MVSEVCSRLNKTWPSKTVSIAAKATCSSGGMNSISDLYPYRIPKMMAATSQMMAPVGMEESSFSSVGYCLQRMALIHRLTVRSVSQQGLCRTTACSELQVTN